MADIFISYANADRAEVAPIVKLFESIGWAVWWDSRISGGQRWDEVIERELESAKCIVAVWSPHSILSRWVRTEAMTGIERGILLPLIIGHAAQPLAFKLVQSIDLTEWSGIETEPIARKLVASAKRIICGNNIARSRKPLDETTRTRRQKGDVTANGNFYVYISEDKIFSLSPKVHQYETRRRAAYIPSIINGLRAEGLITRHGPYISHELTMKWGVVDFGVVDRPVSVVVFYNESRKLLLCGSTKNVIGSGFVEYRYPPAYFGHGGSNLPDVINFMARLSGERTFNFHRDSLPDRDYRANLLAKITPHLVEQKLRFVARLLGVKYGLTVATPIFVALSDGVAAPKRRILRHERADLEELNKRREVSRLRKKSKRATATLLVRLNKLLMQRTLAAYQKSLKLYDLYCHDLGRYSAREGIFGIFPAFREFLQVPEIIKFSSQNYKSCPFTLNDLFVAADQHQMQCTAIRLLEMIFAINYYIPGVDAAYYIAERRIGYARPILERFRDHSEPNVRRWVRTALASYNE